jgi:cell division protease FtsH
MSEQDPQNNAPQDPENQGPEFPFGNGKKPDPNKNPLFKSWRFSILYILIFLVGLGAFNYFFMSTEQTTIDYSEFKSQIVSGQIKRVEISDSHFTGFATAEKPEATAPSVFPWLERKAKPGEEPVRTVAIYDPDLIKLMDEHQVSYYAVSQEGGGIISMILSWVVPIVIIVLMYRFLFRRLGNMGGNILSIGQNKTAIVAEGDIKTKFADVAGVEEAKNELVEVVDFLKNPKKYTEIGGKIPKGVLLVGPPGTGKTLLARAVAGEAEVAFFRMSGAEFVEMFVGVGAARVRDLFKQARDKAPCIIFIDELDAIGKSRINNIAGGNDEREQTLNQLLVEMDGFDGTSGLIIVAATNRPDVLDPALLRPGRFDRQVLVDKPDLVGREAILKIHAKNVKLAPDVDLKSAARGTPGFVGADLANVINEAALLAVRAGRKMVTQKDLEGAIEKSVIGLEKKSRIISEDERKIVSVHETGHALVSHFTPGTDPVQKISIIPTGLSALGYTLHRPTEDRYLKTEDELLAEVDVLLGGRAAEEIALKKVSTGASNDLTRATDIIRSMIVDYGMSSRFKNVALTKRSNGEPSLTREYSEATQQYIDDEIAATINARYNEVKKLLTEKNDFLLQISKILLEKETLNDKEFKDILGEE